MVNRVGAPYRVLLYQPGIRFSLLTNSKVLSLQQQQSDMSIINNYVKNSNDINSLQVNEPQLPKSKSYLKITGISFFPHTNSQEKLTSNDIEVILKQNHIFDNISLTLKPRVIKVFSKSDMSIVWIDIWIFKVVKMLKC